MSENQTQGQLNQPDPASFPHSTDWEQLAPTPRKVSGSVKIQIRLWTFARSVGTEFIGLLVVSSLCIVSGIVFFSFGKSYHLFGLIPVLFGLGIMFALVAVLTVRGSRKIKLLRDGQPARAVLSKVWSGTQGRYASYVQFVEEGERFKQSLHRNSYLLSSVGRQMRRWRCKLRIDNAGKTKEVKTRFDLGAWLMKPVGDPDMLVLHNPQKVQELVTADALPPNLVVGPDGQWVMEQSTNQLKIVSAFFRSFPPVLGTYGSAAISYSLSSKGMFNDATSAIPPLLGATVVLLFTLTHAVVPVFFYHHFLKLQDNILNPHAESTFKLEHPGTGWTHRFASGFVYLHMGLWYGVPTVVFAFMTGGLSLLWAAVHIAFARRPARTWLCLEYGSTSMALLLFVVCFSASRLVPYGIVVVLFQSLLLTLLDWKGRALWVPGTTTAVG